MNSSACLNKKCAKKLPKRVTLRYSAASMKDVRADSNKRFLASFGLSSGLFFTIAISYALVLAPEVKSGLTNKDFLTDLSFQISSIQTSDIESRTPPQFLQAALPSLPDVSTSMETKVISYKVRDGDTLPAILKKTHASSISLTKASEAFKASGQGKLNRGETIEVTKSPNGDVLSVRRSFSDNDYMVISGTESRGYSPTFIRGDTVESERMVSGSISKSFNQSLLSYDVPRSVLDKLVDLFSDRVEFRKDIKKGDTFSIIYNEKKSKNGKVSKSSSINAASLKIDGKLFVAIQHVGVDGKSRYFDETGKPIGTSFLRYPVQFSRISSVFTDSRLHPVLKIRRPHFGVDFAAPKGTPVRTIGDGVVTNASYARDKGYWIKISHTNRYATAYLHLNNIAPKIKVGTKVRQGDLIGTVGMSGLSSGPHLHFALYDNGRYVDPLKVNLPFSVPKENLIPASYLQAKLKLLNEEHTSVQLAMATQANTKVG